jgi:tricorn protease
LERVPEWKGYRIEDLPESDPDFDSTDGVAKYSPLSEQTLRLSGQRGLAKGDVIVAVNGESVMQVPDVNMLLRGMAGQSVRLDVLRLSNMKQSNKTSVEQESIIAVPITAAAASLLRYDSWELKSAELAETLAKEAGFSVGYIHMRAMDTAGETAFARAFFPAFDREGLVIDVRHNLGGNIDSWILSMLQRKAWMFWAGRGVSDR